MEPSWTGRGLAVTDRLRVGIVGLGKRWAARYRPALHTLRDRFTVGAVTDPCPRRAAVAGRDLGCPAAPGVLPLLDFDLDAILLLGRPWYRLWPLEQACRLGKPVYLGTSLADDDGRADSVVQQVRVANLPVMPELLPRLAPVTERLLGLLPKLGPVRSLACTAERPGGGRGATAAGLALLDWCGRFFDRPPAAIRSLGEPTAGHAGWLLDFGGPVAQVATWPGGGRGAVRLRVVGERGWVEAVLPRRMRWQVGRVRHAAELPAGPPLVQRAIEQFHAALSGGRAPDPGLDAAYQALAWLRAARGE
jgi:predicted dehydrogenase